ncbi:amidohydrolase family protein [Leucobacter chromiireducens]|uniref:amidohydrolase family protein n=1 Tax=Leucobacter chromiireducens TaxID=283877 RepID=UPI000F62E705|nr:amidohydrolase family protein [Leucobacter chromiireducens]
MDQARPSAGPASPGVPGAGSIAGVRVFEPDGSFSAPRELRWEHGSFVAAATAAADTAAPAPQRPLGRADAELWALPGLVDAHVHAAWHAFDEDDRRGIAAADRHTATAAGLARTLAAGITRVRDAGGLSRAELAALPAAERPDVQLSVRLLDRAAADAAGGLDRAVGEVLDAGAQWVKLVGTAGVASPAGAGLEPVFSAAEVRAAVARAERAGAAVMMHAWGGDAIDDAIAAGAASIEHGIFLTDQQARAAAAAGLTLVPTLRIYRLVQRMIDAGSLHAAFRARVTEAIGAHPAAVRRARDAGLPIAVGTDSGTPDQHGTAALEVDALRGAGLSAAEALIAATRTGAALLARADRDRGRAVRADAHAGTLRPGAAADAVFFSRDPRELGALADPAAIVGVLRAGVLHAAPPASPLKGPLT